MIHHFTNIKMFSMLCESMSIIFQFYLEYKPGVPFWKYAVTGSEYNNEIKVFVG